MIDYVRALSLADKQKFAWLLTQMEAYGIKTLADGRMHVEEALRLERLARRMENLRRLPNPAPRRSALCPECGAPLYEGGAIESEVPEDQGLVRVGCKKCYHSALIEVE